MCEYCYKNIARYNGMEILLPSMPTLQLPNLYPKLMPCHVRTVLSDRVRPFLDLISTGRGLVPDVSTNSISTDESSFL